MSSRLTTVPWITAPKAKVQTKILFWKKSIKRLFVTIICGLVTIHVGTRIILRGNALRHYNDVKNFFRLEIRFLDLQATIVKFIAYKL